MAIVYSLRLKTNFASGLNNWNDITDTIDANSPPSIQIGAERADTPLVVSVSDLSLSLVNADNRFDDFFDVQAIVGPIPPLPNSALRAPLIHYGQIVLCRKSTDGGASWQVMFYGFIDPKSIIFNRGERMVSITAYAPGKLLEQGNAERINRVFHTGPNGNVAWARPFVLTDKPLVHPALAMGVGDDSGKPSDLWWKLTGGNASSGLDLIMVGDQFEVVAGGSVWHENMEVTKLIDNVFTVAAIAAVGDDLFFSTTEASNVVISGGNVNVLTPWWRGKPWEELALQLVNEASAALSAMGAPMAMFCDTTNLPLLDTGGMLVANRTFSADMNLPIPGLAYTKFNGQPALLYLTKWDLVTYAMAGKHDILTWADIFADHGYTFSLVAPPAAAIAISTIGIHPVNITANGAMPDYNSQDPVIGPMGIHTFRSTGQPANNDVQGQAFKSSHVCATPSSFLNAGLGHTSFWEIIAYSQFTTGGAGNPPSLKQGIQIARYQSTDGGKTWSLPYNDDDLFTHPVGENGDAPWPSAFAQAKLGLGTEFGQSWRPSIKVFKLGTNSYLYCWIDPIEQGAYYKTSTTDEENTAGFFFPAGNRPTPFLYGGSADSPINASSFVQQQADGTTFGPVWLFDERADGTGVSLFYWNGAGFSVGNIVDATGRGLSLTGGDFINAIVDCTRNPKHFYVVIGHSLYALTYTWSAPNFTVTDWKVVDLDFVNYDRTSEANATGIVSNTNAVAWLAGPVQQNNAGEPNYVSSSDAVLVGTLSAISIVSDTPPNTVDVADFEGKSCAAALSDLLLVRGYQMITGAQADVVSDPNSFEPTPLIKFRPRLKALTDTSSIDLSAYTEACEDGVWFLNYSAVGVQNSKQKIGPIYNDSTLSDVAGNTYTIKQTRYAGSAALSIDSPLILSKSMMRLLANIFAGEFLIPRTTATVVIRDPFIEEGVQLEILDIVKFLRRGPSDTSTVVLYGQGRLMTIDYGLESKLLTLRVT